MNNQNNNNIQGMLDQALDLLENHGWSIIPIGQDKKPLISWQKYQKTKPAVDEVKEWFTRFPSANIGIVTGELSNLTVVDIDPRHDGTNEAFRDLDTVAVQTGGGGYHYYFTYKQGVKNGAGVKPGIDIRSEGGYVIAPPSLHQSGGHYEWIKSPSSLLPLPMFIKEWIKQSKKKTTDKIGYRNSEVLNGVGEGQRNDSAASVIGKLLKSLKKDEWEAVAWPLVASWNTKNTPPLTEVELRATFDSISLKELQSGGTESSGRESLAKELVTAILDTEILVFHDEYKEGYVSLTGDGREILKLRSKGFRKWIAHFAYKEFDKIAPSETIINVIQTLEGRAIFEGDKYQLSVRLTEYQEAIWYDLADGQAIKIDSNGWKITDKPPIIFKRFPHQDSQVQPMLNGNVDMICDFVNLKNDKDRLLFQVFTVSSFIPNFPHPLLVLHGPQGAGKSTPMRLLKSLIDPSVLKTLSVPDSEREFAQLASHHHFFFFDNLSSLPSWLSDSLAKASTGDGFSKRELYSDDDDIIYSFQRTMGINGINLVVEKADLLDRSILLGLERISKKDRRQEKEFWKKFDDIKPQLLGAIFTAVSQALKYYPEISLPSYPRMADFARWGCSIARALGYSDEEFMNAYYGNISAQSEAAIDASPVGTAIIELMEEKQAWQGTASELLTILEEFAKTIKINIKSRNWPKDPSWLVRRIQVVVPNLLEQGILFERDDKARPKTITLQKIQENGDNADMQTNKEVTMPESIPSPSNDKDIPTDGDADGKVRLSNQPTSSPTASSPVSTDNHNTTGQVVSKNKKAIEIIEHNIQTEKIWNEFAKEHPEVFEEKLEVEQPHTGK